MNPVAPRVGAGIETNNNEVIGSEAESRPSSRGGNRNILNDIWMNPGIKSPLE